MPRRVNANLSISVDGEVLERARDRASRERTTLAAILRSFLESYAGGPARDRPAVERLLELSRTATSGRGASTWTREELHERPTASRAGPPTPSPDA